MEAIFFIYIGSVVYLFVSCFVIDFCGVTATTFFHVLYSFRPSFSS